MPVIAKLKRSLISENNAIRDKGGSMDFLQQIYNTNFGKLSAPFTWDETPADCRIYLYADDFKADMVGNGLAWDAIVIVYLLETIPLLFQDIKFQSTSAIFQAVSVNKEAMKQFILSFKKVCDNNDAFYKLIHRVNFNLTVKAVLDFWSEHSSQLQSGIIVMKRFTSLFNRRFPSNR
jgi:hypothetical protein